MSHFVVISAVLGDQTVESQLAPYHEFECTGFDNEFIQDIDITLEFREEHDKHNEHLAQCSSPLLTELQFLALDYEYETVPRGIDRKSVDGTTYGYALVDEHDSIMRVYKRTNPNAKWDWYSVGGRWDGMLITRDGDKVNQALKNDIDLEAMLSKGVKKKLEDFDLISPWLIENNWHTWHTVRVELDHDVNLARDTYHAQKPALHKFLESEGWERDDLIWLDPDDMVDITREDYEALCRQHNLTYALLDSNGWHQRGEMGWFGMSSNEIERNDWFTQWMSVWDNLPDDAWISVIDCHI